jgi:hypothetical protein
MAVEDNLRGKKIFITMQKLRIEKIVTMKGATMGKQLRGNRGLF